MTSTPNHTEIGYHGIRRVRRTYITTPVTERVVIATSTGDDWTERGMIFMTDDGWRYANIDGNWTSPAVYGNFLDAEAALLAATRHLEPSLRALLRGHARKAAWKILRRPN